MTEQIIQIFERDESRGLGCWKIRTVIQLWPNIPEERDRLLKFMECAP